ncbi:unnamed protein product [Darwinula stevensoni]|uniref:Uncharacterized protein n=1 Tax=Darwinula stevensoni TaxID=69355 RepID=A0A7R9A9Z1_9CRUS|nr:unnamed protein product [Darwinula stevensoni]CAG0897672.1 unnamed protein product [Darwinula stevensoni]
MLRDLQIAISRQKRLAEAVGMGGGMEAAVGFPQVYVSVGLNFLGGWRHHGVPVGASRELSRSFLNMENSPIQAWSTEKMHAPVKKPQGEIEATIGRKTQAARNILKAFVIAACAALAIRQVILLIEDYQSIPSITLYATENSPTIKTPAFTFCPKSSIRSSVSSDSGPTGNYTIGKKFRNGSISLSDFVLQAPGNMSFWKVGNVSILNGETITSVDGENLSFSCKRKTNGNPRKASSFTNRPVQMEIYVHDATEEYNRIESTEYEMFLLRECSLRVLIRPEVTQRLSRWNDPCTMEEGYSYTRLSIPENCFWENLQKRTDLPCLDPAFLPNDGRLTKPECKDADDETIQLGKLDWGKPEVSHFLEQEKVPFAGSPLERRRNAGPLSRSFPRRHLQHLRGDLFPHLPEAALTGACSHRRQQTLIPS